MNTKKLIKKIGLLLVVSLMSISSVWAADLQSAKADGLIGEQADGYLGLVVASAPADVKALVVDVNQKRKEKYQEVAQKQNVGLAEIERIAGEKAFEKTSSGNYVQENGKWIKK